MDGELEMAFVPGRVEEGRASCVQGVSRKRVMDEKGREGVKEKGRKGEILKVCFHDKPRIASTISSFKVKIQGLPDVENQKTEAIKSLGLVYRRFGKGSQPEYIDSSST